MSWTGLPEFADDTITYYSRPSPTIKSNTDDTNRNSSATETRESSSIIISKPAIKSDSLKGNSGTKLEDSVRTKRSRGLPEFTDDTITDYSRPSPTIEGNTDDTNRNSSATETRESSSIIISKPAIKFVKAADRPAERPTTDKVETAKKPSVKSDELYRKTTKSSKVRGNQRNWNNLKSHQLGANFVMKKKACYNYGGIDYLYYDCGLGVKKGRTCSVNTHKSNSPRPVVHKTVRSPTRTNRPHVNSARPQTTQDLTIILIQRV
nr:hypothetical protein [Tanacetum cinerariifolium]GEY65247.1 hypothetical protein [Tanacetum cinerariifolium]